MDLQALWQTTLGELELTLSKANFTTWFRNTFIGSFENGRITVSVPNTFTKSWLEQKYHAAILKALRSTTNQGVREVHYRVEVKNTTVLPLESIAAEALDQMQASAPEMAETVSAGPGRDIGLNPRYVFKNFVVGKNNELAHAACMAIAAKPGDTYNPLFIYGGAGMGKTHLLQAIGHHLAANFPGLRIRYATCERFTNEFIQAVRSGRGNEFKEMYRNIDALLIDDVQFLSGKEGTQEEFFNTFNALHQNNKQIVITSDRPPKDIQTLESRMVSRLEWGMLTDISMPDFETRVAILQTKAREKTYPLSTEILHAMAGAIQSNVRELEGALNKVIAYHQFKNIQPCISTVQSLLQSFAPNVSKHSITARHLLEVVTRHYDISLDNILSKSRERRFAFPRQVAMYLLREEIKCSFPTIGSHIGGRDHTTAMHACHKITDLVKENEQLKRDLVMMRERLYSQPTLSSVRA
ncbi:chromosomal replication initiator protein DnaA [Candidatus Uhrbacteria bacterium]|nr:chromosomal replication initiator protein DnaA [Candidatus Uhrbacteria bacterium]